MDLNHQIILLGGESERKTEEKIMDKESGRKVNWFASRHD